MAWGAGDVRARGRRALLALVLERATDQDRGERRRVGRRVGDDEVLAARLTDETRVGAVVRDVLPDRAPQVLEGRGGAGEVDPGEVRLAQGDVGDRLAVAGDQVDHARREAGLFE